MTDQKELTIIPNRQVVEVGNRIDLIVNECLPVATQESQNFVQALTLANGIRELRQIFLTDKNIKETVQSMQNTHLGFMTDRTDLAIWKSQQKGSNKEIKPYRYEDVAEVCIEAMLKGYRITNNEFNMIASRFYAAKNGKFRRINEMEGVTDFHFTTTTPLYEKEQGGIQYAKVQAFASWKKDGQTAMLGASTVKSEDKLVFKIRVNKFMGEDAIVGKALSKLFTRVLMRLEGKIMPESTDLSDDDVVDAEITDTSDLSEKIKQQKDKTPKPGSLVDAEFEETPPTKNDEPETDEAKPPESTEEKQPEPELQKMEQGVEENSEEFFRARWINMREPGFSSFVYKNRSKFDGISNELLREAAEKWKKLYPRTLWPLKNPVEADNEDEKTQMIKAISDFFNPSDITAALHEQGLTTLTACDMAMLQTIYTNLRENTDTSEDLA